MNDFNKLCKVAEELNPLEYGAIIAEKTVKIIPALNEVCENPQDAVMLLASFMIASVYADGKLDESEYVLMMPMLHHFFGADFDYQSAKAMAAYFKPEGKELKKAVNDIIDILGLLSDDLKSDIITVCLLVCAVDGKVSFREKQYIKQLIKD